MFKGVLIGESLREGTSLEGVPLTVRKMYRVAPPSVTCDQPPVWCVGDFEVADEDADRLAAALSEILDQPGWYCDFRSQDEQIVVFPGKVFRYARGDQAGRAEAAACG